MSPKQRKPIHRWKDVQRDLKSIGRADDWHELAKDREKWRKEVVPVKGSGEGEEREKKRVVCVVCKKTCKGEYGLRRGCTRGHARSADRIADQQQD
jgi:hypothetical protein